MNLDRTRLGKYEIHSEIGAGAMGVVYRAHDPVLNRTVAVKVLYPHLTGDRQFVERFLREARAAASLDHPNIVTVYDAGEDSGWYFFVMQYLDGRPINALLREKGALPPDQALRVLQQLGSALDYAHRAGMVHRDVKPANVMIDGRGRVTLTDFGLVRAAQDSRMTTTGTVLGTPQYMSPEQARGTTEVGPASDLYSLAVMAYEILGGAVPFDADSTPAILHKHVYEPPPPIIRKRSDLSPAVDKVFSKALAKAPESRYRSGADFVAALTAVLGSQAVRAPGAKPAQPTATSGRGRSPVLIFGLVGAVILGVLLCILICGGLYYVGTVYGGTPTPTRTGARPATPTTAPLAGANTPTPPGATSTPEPTNPPPTAAGPGLGDTWSRPADEMVMVYVPGGVFRMGSDEADVDDAVRLCVEDIGTCERTTFADEQPAHRVTLDGFWVDATEVTNAQYEGCVTAGACQAPVLCDWGEPTFGEGSMAEHPVVCVDWFDANVYCEWADGRLPTEAEWEYAARGPLESTYPWGDTFDCERGNFDDEKDSDVLTVPGPEGCDGYDETAPVASYVTGVSWSGALDMAGNVWEWVSDWYGPYPSVPQENPTGPETGDTKLSRGGSWYAVRGGVRSAFRNVEEPLYRSHDIGFRCVVPVTTAP